MGYMDNKLHGYGSPTEDMLVLQYECHKLTYENLFMSAGIRT